MKKSKIRVFCMRFLLAVGICVASLLFIDHMTEWQAHISPKYSRMELKPMLDRAAVRQSIAQLESLAAISSGLDGHSEGEHENAEFLLTEDEYDLLYHQTGLGRSNIDRILRKPEGEKELHEAQETFFTDPEQTCVRDNWFSSREQTIDESGGVIRATELTGVENGDIIITKSSHVFGWRNGHAALVVDAKNGETLEAIVIGENTGLRRFKKWEKYPNYLVLRLEGVDSKQRAEIAKWAEQNLVDIPYQLTAGFFGAKGETPAPVTGTQCAHLIWRAYAQFGYDLDENGGWLITPRQLTKSSQLEVVQVYGMDPDNPWP